LALLGDSSISSVLDLILMDISMPEMNGIDVARIIRENNLVDRNIPIIAMTAHVQPVEQDGFMQAGMDGFLGKPFQLAELMEVLRQHERNFCNERFLKLKAETSVGAIDKLVASFRRDAEKRLMVLRCTCEDEDWSEFSSQCHALGSNAGMFGTLALYRICRKVESANKKKEYQVISKLAPDLIELVLPSVEKVEMWLNAEQS
jgi:CheY-like chemotaxis protein/HPt (histidine-containing phosphotransfer) domain-containing protein